MNIHSITIAIFLAASVSFTMNMDKPAPNLAETLDPDLWILKMLYGIAKLRI